jgi:hypothetical protein
MLFDSVNQRKGCAGGGVEAALLSASLVGIVLVNSGQEKRFAVPGLGGF